jgi:hypothetical protein
MAEKQRAMCNPRTRTMPSQQQKEKLKRRTLQDKKIIHEMK